MAWATETASAVLMTVDIGSIASPSAVRPSRSSRKAVTSTSMTSGGGETGTPDSCSSRVASSSTSRYSVSKSAIGKTVSKLNGLLRAALISLTPRSRVFVVAMTLNPCRAKVMASGPDSSGTARLRSESRESRQSCTSRGQRVISSKRTTPLRTIPVSIGAGTRAAEVGPSATSMA